jgi:DNA-binding PucR family transcriptional regulator
MNDSLFEKLVEISWRRRLTPGEELELQAWLATHPEDAERWESEAGLNRILDHLEPIAPSSNFTRRVLELVTEDRRISNQQRPRSWSERLGGAWRLRWPRLAWSLGAILVAGTFAVYQYHDYADAQFARGVESFTHSFSTVSAITAPEALEDFEAIQEISAVRPNTSPTDEALFALLGSN